MEDNREVRDTRKTWFTWPHLPAVQSITPPRWISYLYSILGAGTTCVHNTYGSTLFFLSTSCIVWTENEIFFLIFWIITFTCSPSCTWPFIQSFNYSINQVMNFFVSISCWCQNIILFGIKNLSFFYHIFFFLKLKSQYYFYLLAIPPLLQGDFLYLIKLK